jgi:hypothetical protein
MSSFRIIPAQTPIAVPGVSGLARSLALLPLRLLRSRA